MSTSWILQFGIVSSPIQNLQENFVVSQTKVALCIQLIQMDSLVVVDLGVVFRFGSEPEAVLFWVIEGLVLTPTRA